MTRPPRQTALAWFAGFFCFVVGCGKPPEPVPQPTPTPPDTIDSEKARLQGKWLLLMTNGKMVTGDAFEFTDTRVVYEYTTFEKVPHADTLLRTKAKIEYSYSLDITTTPRTIDCTDSKGRVRPGIYSFTEGPKKPAGGGTHFVIRLGHTERPTDFRGLVPEKYDDYVFIQ